MTPTSPEEVAKLLKAGQCPPVAEWLIAKGAQLIADEVVPAASTLKVEEARAAAGALNNECYFALTRSIAEAWAARFDFDPVLQKRRVQALINTTLLDDAERMAQEGIALCEKKPDDATYRKELLEFRGLQGRIAKQRFVNSSNPDYLQRATDCYLAEYLKAPLSYWHGINALACLLLEAEEGVARPNMPEPKALAEKIFATADDAYRKRSDSWAIATASEACLALERCDEAELWLYRMLLAKETTRFQVDSYYRQLRELWRGDPLTARGCAGRLASIVANYIANSQSRILLSPSQVPAIESALERDRKGLEQNFLGESSFTVASIESLLEAFRSVGCVLNDIGERLGTGFLVPGSWLLEKFGDAPVFVTNAHVISERFPKAIPAAKARVSFELDGRDGKDAPRFAVGEILFSSDPGAVGVRNDKLESLDCTVVRLKGLRADAPALKPTRDLPLPGPLTKAFVAGHPRGAGLQIALHDSLLLDVDDDERLVHYRTPTDPGSSGSPVFNADWEVVALHHAGLANAPRLRGKGTYEANEGISLNAIRRKLRS